MTRNVRAGSQRNPLIAAILASIASIALLAPGGAGAATIVNGNFETGTLSGWNVTNSPPPPATTGNWFAYFGTASPFSPIGGSPVPPPPAGQFAAISDQGGPGLHILYQDVALEPSYTHTLSMLVYYESQAALITPSPNTLSFESTANQQYRIDVMRPTANIESVNPADILATVFATKTGDPQNLGPTLLTANLTPFAGQTIRLRLAEVDNQLFLRGGADSIAIQSVAPPPSNTIVVGKAVLNKKNGTAKLPVTVPGAGVLSAVDANFVTIASGSAKKKRMVKSATVTATAPGIINVPLKPTGHGRKVLNKKGKLKIRVALTFTPTGGTAATTTVKVTLKKTVKPKPKKP